MADEYEPLGEAELIEGLEKKKISGKKLVVLVIALAVLGAVGYLGKSMFEGSGEPEVKTEADKLDDISEELTPKEEKKEEVKIEMLFVALRDDLDSPEAKDITVKLNTGGQGTSYISVQVSLEVDRAPYKVAIEKQMPAVISELNSYLMQLRPEDVNGSMGIERLKEELMARFNQSIAPARVKDVHFIKFVVNG